MDTNKILNSDYLDIIFDGRNKYYGSYELRSKYPDRMRKATLIGLSISVLAVLIPIIANAFKPATAKNIEITRPIDLTPIPVIDKKIPPPPPPPPTPPVPPKPTITLTPPVIDKDINVTEPIPEQKDLKDKQIGAHTQDGDPNSNTLPDGPVKYGDRTGASGPQTPPQVYINVEQMPIFANLENYLSKNIRYPDNARENGISGRVIVKFIVNEDGSVSDVHVVRGVGGGCDEEASRVVSAMPAWTPGKQNGHAVKVYFTLPISFKLE